MKIKLMDDNQLNDAIKYMGEVPIKDPQYSAFNFDSVEYKIMQRDYSDKIEFRIKRITYLKRKKISSNYVGMYEYEINNFFTVKKHENWFMKFFLGNFKNRINNTLILRIR